MGNTLSMFWTVYRLDRIMRQSPERVQALQTSRLRRLLYHTVNRSRFYRQRFQGIDIKNCRLNDLPTLTKAELMDNYEDVVTDPRITRSRVEDFMAEPANRGKLFLDRYVVCHTSGSQGRPAFVVQEFQHLLTAYAAQVSRAITRHRHPFFLAVQRLREPARIAVITQRPGFYPSGSMFMYLATAQLAFQRMLRLSVFDSPTELATQLNRFRPHHLIGYSSSLEIVAREEAAGRLQLRQTGCLEMVTNISEPLPAAVRTAIEAAFGVHVGDQYALGECMGLTSGCRVAAGSHLNADLACLEVVDEENRPVPNGEPGNKVLITNLYNTTQPFIRYEVGDVVTMAAQPCLCGSVMPHIASIAGRTKERLLLDVNGEQRELPYYVFLHGLNQCPEVTEHQVVQTDQNQFLVRVTLQPGKTASPDHIRKLIDDTIAAEGVPVRLNMAIEVVPEIGPDRRTGKRQRVINLLNATEGDRNDNRAQYAIGQAERGRPGSVPNLPGRRWARSA